MKRVARSMAALRGLREGPSLVASGGPAFLAEGNAAFPNIGT